MPLRMGCLVDENYCASCGFTAVSPSAASRNALLGPGDWPPGTASAPADFSKKKNTYVTPFSPAAFSISGHTKMSLLVGLIEMTGKVSIQLLEASATESSFQRASRSIVAIEL